MNTGGNKVYAMANKKLGRCRDNATCETLEKKSKTTHFFIFRITKYYDRGRLRRADSQDTELSCHMLIYTLYYTM